MQDVVTDLTKWPPPSKAPKPAPPPAAKASAPAPEPEAAGSGLRWRGKGRYTQTNKPPRGGFLVSGYTSPTLVAILPRWPPF
jgi:hypothetical protein